MHHKNFGINVYKIVVKHSSSILFQFLHTIIEISKIIVIYDFNFN